MILFHDDQSIAATHPRAEYEALGINTGPDTNNRLSVKSEYSLFTHADGTPSKNAHLTINKGTSTDKASIILQEAY